MTVEESVILKYEQTLSVCSVGQVCTGVGWGRERGRGRGSASQSVCVLGRVAIA